MKTAREKYMDSYIPFGYEAKDDGLYIETFHPFTDCTGGYLESIPLEGGKFNNFLFSPIFVSSLDTFFCEKLNNETFGAFISFVNICAQWDGDYVEWALLMNPDRRDELFNLLLGKGIIVNSLSNVLREYLVSQATHLWMKEFRESREE